MDIKNRYAAFLILAGLISVFFGATLNDQKSFYSNYLYITGLALNLIGTIVIVVNMYHKRGS